METKPNLPADKQEKLIEIQAQQEKLRKLQSELSNLNTKVEKSEKLTTDELEYLGELGWLSAAAVTIAAIASGL